MRIPPLGISVGQWRVTRLPEKALLLAAELCDVDRVCEEPPGSNRGGVVDEMLKTARTDVGQPWCAAFVTYCVKSAGKDPYSRDYGKGVRYPASVVSWAEWARATGRWSRTPRRGRLFVLARAGHTHIGFVSRDNNDGTFATIEGNSNDEGAREGYETCRRTRRVDSVSGFIDLGDWE